MFVHLSYGWYKKAPVKQTRHPNLYMFKERSIFKPNTQIYTANDLKRRPQTEENDVDKLATKRSDDRRAYSSI